MGMRKTMIALLAASASISALANTNGSDIWQQYTPLMVTEIYAMTASSDEVVSVLQAEGDFLLSNLGVAHNPRLQSMSQAILAMEERGMFRGTLDMLGEALLVPDLLPTLPRDETIAVLMAKPDTFTAIKGCLRDDEFSKQAACHALGLYMAAVRVKPKPDELKVLANEFMNPRGVYPTILDISRFLVKSNMQEIPIVDTGSAHSASTHAVGQHEAGLEVMKAKRLIINAVGEASRLE